MRHRFAPLAASLMAGVLMLAGCAPQRVASAGDAPATMAPPRPEPPSGLPSAAQVPALGADGAYLTINHGLGATRAAWHVRAALNVAALGCRGPADAALTADYNRVLARQAAPLAAAYRAVRAEDRARFAGGWQAAHDAAMTRLYNFFAQPFAKEAFCARASAVAGRAALVAPAEFASFAPGALAELEAPFLAGYRRFDAYRQELAAWDAAYGGAPGSAPRLAYAPLATVIAWEPATQATRVALAR